MFYVLEVSTGDSKIAGKAVYQYPTITEAVATFHSKLGAAMKSDLYDSELIMVIEANGSVVCSERYIKPEPITE